MAQRVREKKRIEKLRSRRELAPQFLVRKWIFVIRASEIRRQNKILKNKFRNGNII